MRAFPFYFLRKPFIFCSRDYKLPLHLIYWSLLCKDTAEFLHVITVKISCTEIFNQQVNQTSNLFFGFQNYFEKSRSFKEHLSSFKSSLLYYHQVMTLRNDVILPNGIAKSYIDCLLMASSKIGLLQQMNENWKNMSV